MEKWIFIIPSCIIIWISGIDALQMLTARQVSTQNGNGPERAFDANDATCSKTGPHSTVWWEVTLNNTVEINNVEIKGSVSSTEKMSIHVGNTTDPEGDAPAMLSPACATWLHVDSSLDDVIPCKYPMVGSVITVKGIAAGGYSDLEICNIEINK